MKKTSKKQRIKFVFELGIPQPQKNFYTKNIYLVIRKLNELFLISPSFIIINVFRNRISFLRAICKKAAPDWLVAYIPPKNTSIVYLLINNKNLTAKQKAISRQILLHEITHLYTNTLNSNLPDWLKEGISVYIANQIFKPSILITDWRKIAPRNMPFERISWQFAAEHNGYNIAGLLVMFFVKRYGWTRFITAINCCGSKCFSIKNIPLYFGEKLNWLMVDFKKQFVK